MIPKIIHYCWFGRGKMLPLMKKCLRSWKKYCPDYEIIEWNEDNFDVNSTPWTKQAYEAKKYAFVADYVRLRVLYEHGGIYMDTDQELIKGLGPFLGHQAFMGFMNDNEISMGIVGAVPRSQFITDFFEYYQGRHFLIDGNETTTANTVYATEVLKKYGLVINNQFQEVAGIAIYPQVCFCPPLQDVPVFKKKMKHTYAIHHFTFSWRSKKARRNYKRSWKHQKQWYRMLEQLRYLPNRIARKVLGNQFIDKLKRLGK